MVMRSNPYYNSHILAQVGNNLASAIYGDPDYKFKQQANDRANLQTQMAVSQHQQANEAAARRTAANEALASVFDDPHGDIRAAIGPYLRQDGDLGSALMLMGLKDPRHLQAVDRIDTEYGHRGDLQDDAQAATKQLWNERNLAGIFEALIRAEASKNSGSARAPMDVSATDLNHLNQMLNGRLEELAGSGYEIDPELRQSLQSEVASRYQGSRNAGSALSEVIDMLDIQRGDEGGWFGIGSEPGSVSLKDVLGETAAATPGAAPAAPPAGDPLVVLEEARQAIAKGADPQAVAQRLIDMGIDPAGL